MNLLSPAIKAASAFTLGGAAFALANLLLARSLSMQDYGQFTLVLAMATLGVSLGPLSLDAVVLRHRPGPKVELFRFSLLTGGVVAMVAAITGWVIYSIEYSFLITLVVVIIAGSMARLCASVYQSEERFAVSLWLIQSQNITLILAALFAGWVASVSANVIFSAYALHWVVAAGIGVLLLRVSSGIVTSDDWKVPWKENVPLFGHLLTMQLAAQLDRLIIPKLLDIESLATFGVLSAVVLAPFKMFQAGVGYTLVPGLRTAESRTVRKGILVHEAGISALVIVSGITSGFVIAPWVVELLLKGKYELGQTLIAAAVFAGSLRVVAVFVSAITTALGTQVQLTWLNRSSWVALLASIAGGWWGSRWGLAGLVFGFASGILLRISVATWLAVAVWRHPLQTSRVLGE